MDKKTKGRRQGGFLSQILIAPQNPKRQAMDGGDAAQNPPGL